MKTEHFNAFLRPCVQVLEIVGTASNGLEALKRYKELKPDFVTLDLVMPQMGRLQTLVLLKNIDPQALA